MPRCAFVCVWGDEWSCVWRGGGGGSNGYLWQCEHPRELAHLLDAVADEEHRDAEADQHHHGHRLAELGVRSAPGPRNVALKPEPEEMEFRSSS